MQLREFDSYLKMIYQYTSKLVSLISIEISHEDSLYELMIAIRSQKTIELDESSFIDKLTIIVSSQ